MARVGVERSIGANSAFAQQAQAAARKKGAAMLKEVGATAVENAEGLAADEFYLDRPAARRHAGARRLRGSFKAEVTASGTGPITVRLFSTAADVKVMALEEGSRAHDISAKGPNGLWLPAGGKDANKGKRQGSRRLGSAVQAYETNKEWVGQTVHHPGTKGKHVMRRALEAAVRTHLRRSVVAKRR